MRFIKAMLWIVVILGLLYALGKPNVHITIRTNDYRPIPERQMLEC